MIWLVVAVIAVALVYGVHRLALWADERWWLYYRTKRSGPAPWLGTLESIYKPETEHLIEEQSGAEIKADQDDSGDGSHQGGRLGPGDR